MHRKHLWLLMQQKRFLSRQRSDSGIYQLAMNEASDYTQDPPTLSRHKQFYRRVDDGVPSRTYFSTEAYYQQQYYEV